VARPEADERYREEVAERPGGRDEPQLPRGRTVGRPQLREHRPPGHVRAAADRERGEDDDRPAQPVRPIELGWRPLCIGWRVLGVSVRPLDVGGRAVGVSPHVPVAHSPSTPIPIRPQRSAYAVIEWIDDRNRENFF
jgi:hypothetical protein